MEIINTFKKNFVPDNTANYHLSIQGNATRFSFAVMDIAEKKYIGLKNHVVDNEDNIKSLLKRLLVEDTVFAINFKSVIFQYQSYRAMLVPDTLFDSKNLKAFLKFHHNLDENDHILYQPLKQAEAYVIFSVPTYYEELLSAKYTDIKYSHHCLPFIYNAIENRGKESTNPCLHVHFTNDFFDVLIVRNNKIQLFNSFFYKKYTDVIYFIINILNLYSYLPTHTKIFLSGEIEENSDLYKELNDLFKPINLEKFEPSFKYSSEMGNIGQHKFTNLINAYNCV
jgi:hypothetical protein